MMDMTFLRIFTFIIFVTLMFKDVEGKFTARIVGFPTPGKAANSQNCCFSYEGFHQEIHVSEFPCWKPTEDFPCISLGFPCWETQEYWQCDTNLH